MKRIDSLDDWLDAATRGLCADAQERISEEVTAHFEDAFAEARGDGLTDSKAVATAVASLGDPNRARRRLRRQHFTERESRVLHRMIEERAAGTVFDNNLAIPPQTRRVVFIVVAAPFALVAAIIAGIALVNEDLMASAIETLPALAIGGLLVFFSIGGIFLARIMAKWRRPLSIWRRARLSALGNAVSSVFNFLLFVGWGITEIWTRQQIHEDFEIMTRQVADGWAPVPPALPPIDGMFVMLTAYFGVSSMAYLILAIWYERFSIKLRRLGFDEPPSAMA